MTRRQSQGATAAPSLRSGRPGRYVRTFGHAALPSCGDLRIAGESEQSHGEPSGALPSRNARTAISATADDYEFGAGSTQSTNIGEVNGKPKLRRNLSGIHS